VSARTTGSRMAQYVYVLIVPCRNVCRFENDACAYWSWIRLSFDCNRSSHTPKFEKVNSMRDADLIRRSEKIARHTEIASGVWSRRW